MAQTQAPSRLFDELAELFSTAPQPDQILAFSPSQASVQRATELLELNRAGQLSKDERHEIEQFEQAELLMRMVKARIRVGKKGETAQ